MGMIIWNKSWRVNGRVLRFFWLVVLGLRSRWPLFCLHLHDPWLLFRTKLLQGCLDLDWRSWIRRPWWGIRLPWGRGCLRPGGLPQIGSFLHSDFLCWSLIIVSACLFWWFCPYWSPIFPRCSRIMVGCVGGCWRGAGLWGTWFRTLHYERSKRAACGSFQWVCSWVCRGVAVFHYKWADYSLVVFELSKSP